MGGHSSHLQGGCMCAAVEEVRFCGALVLKECLNKAMYIWCWQVWGYICVCSDV